MSGTHIRTLDLTPPQFDIIATLGNTEGMSFKELGEKTLITKGTLTGVVDRLEAKGLVRRVESTEDKRSTIVRLTAKGESVFKQVFPPHVEFCKLPFLGYREQDFGALERELAKLKMHLEAAAEK
ncbi:MarR family transcriptional regulator [Herbaspirillum sp. HC18]|nr:MarR family transcriptional regulator [Herbaspirillum sp. HC18]